jgi:hypothetical protein
MEVIGEKIEIVMNKNGFKLAGWLKPVGDRLSSISL